MIVLIIIGAIVGIILLAGLVMKKKYSISSEVIIDRPKEVVFDYVKHLRNQEKYSKWVMADPNVELEYKGTDGTVGFSASWKSNDKNVGVGEQEIIKIKEGERYDVEIRFEKPFKGTSYAYTTAEPLGSGKTKVTTVFNTTTPFPMNLMVPMIEKMLKKDMAENAANLKRVLEGQ